MRINDKKWIFFIIVLLFVLIFSVVKLKQYYYPELNSDSVNIFILGNHHVSKNENVFYSIIGLNAPKEVIDIHSYGVELIQQSVDKYIDDDMKHLKGDVDLPHNPNSINLNVDTGKLVCWLGKASGKAVDNCYTPDELTKVVENNQLLLERFEQLLSYDKYISKFPFNQNGKLLMNVYKLYVANARNKLLTDSDNAVKSLVDGLRFSRKMFSQTQTWIEKAIWLVNYGLSLSQLEYVLLNHTDIAINYKTMLFTQLVDLSIDELNITGVYQAEFEMLNYLLCIDMQLGIETDSYCQKETELDRFSASFIMNDYYKRYETSQRTLSLGYERLVEHCEIAGEYSGFNMNVDILLHFPILVEYSTYNLFVYGMVKGCRMVENFRIKGARLRLLKMFLDIKANGIDENNIKLFLENHVLKDVISGNSFIYDEGNKLLMFPPESPDLVKKLYPGMKL